MRKSITVLFSVLLMNIPSLPYAQLDLEKEVLVIPDTHDAEPYRWKKSWNIWDYDLRVEPGALIAGTDSLFVFTIKTRSPRTIHSINVFVTDRKMQTFQHIRPEFSDGRYRFMLHVPSQGRYRFEFVLETAEDGWVNLSEDISIKEGVKQPLPALSGGEDKDVYTADIRLFPEKVYAEHVVTLLYEINHNGIPVRYPDKTDGTDILIASWDESGKEFVCAGSGQNVNGQIAASIVFMKPGRHRVFAEFRHNGAVRVVSTDIDVLEEPPQREHGITTRSRSIYD